MARVTSTSGGVGRRSQNHAYSKGIARLNTPLRTDRFRQERAPADYKKDPFADTVKAKADRVAKEYGVSPLTQVETVFK